MGSDKRVPWHPAVAGFELIPAQADAHFGWL